MLSLNSRSFYLAHNSFRPHHCEPSLAKGTLMTSIKKLTVATAMAFSLLTLSVYAQSPDAELNHFATRGISFDYPAGYSVADESTTEAQNFVITRKGSSIQLAIVVMRGVIQGNELPAATENF